MQPVWRLVCEPGRYFAGAEAVPSAELLLSSEENTDYAVSFEERCYELDRLYTTMLGCKCCAKDRSMGVQCCNCAHAVGFHKCVNPAADHPVVWKKGTL